MTSLQATALSIQNQELGLDLNPSEAQKLGHPARAYQEDRAKHADGWQMVGSMEGSQLGSEAFIH